MVGSGRLKVCTYLKHFKQDTRVHMRYVIFCTFILHGYNVICFENSVIMINIKITELKNATDHVLINTFFAKKFSFTKWIVHFPCHKF